MWRRRTSGVVVRLLIGSAAVSGTVALHTDPNDRAAAVLRRIAAFADVAHTGQRNEVMVTEHGSQEVRQPRVDNGDDAGDTFTQAGTGPIRQRSRPGPRYTPGPDDAVLAPATQSAQDAIQMLDKVRTDLEEVAGLDRIQGFPDRLRANLEREIEDMEDLLAMDLPDDYTQLEPVLKPVLEAARRSLAQLGPSPGDTPTPSAGVPSSANTSQPSPNVSTSPEAKSSAPSIDVPASKSWPSAEVSSSSDPIPSDGWFPAGAGPVKSRVVGPAVTERDDAKGSASNAAPDRLLRPAGDAAVKSATAAPPSEPTPGMNSTSTAWPGTASIPTLKPSVGNGTAIAVREPSVGRGTDNAAGPSAAGASGGIKASRLRPWLAGPGR